MTRFQLSLNVADVEDAVAFYRDLLGVNPAKHRPGYANFVVADPPLKLVVIEGEGAPGTLNHVGIEHPDPDGVARAVVRLRDRGLPVVEDEPHTCCYATQAKAWSRDPDGVPWEVYTVVDDTEHFGHNPHGGTPVDALLPPVQLDELAAALEDPDVVVIDAQGDGGFVRAHLPGAVDVALDEVLDRAADLITGPDQRVILYCTDEACLGSEFVGTQLVDAGYTNVGRYPGGVRGWAESGGEVVAGPEGA